ncbi:mCG146990 [Mus musculus]|nr:mCG146990 [Mus musculus]
MDFKDRSLAGNAFTSHGARGGGMGCTSRLVTVTSPSQARLQRVCVVKSPLWS